MVTADGSILFILSTIQSDVAVNAISKNFGCPFLQLKSFLVISKELFKSFKESRVSGTRHN